MRVLAAWVGDRDLEGSSPDTVAGPGPIARVLDALPFDRVILFASQSAEQAQKYADTLKAGQGIEVSLSCVTLPDSTAVKAIYDFVIEALEAQLPPPSRDRQVTFQLDPGNWAISWVWTFLSESRFPAGLVQVTPDNEVSPVALPCDLRAELFSAVLEPEDSIFRGIEDADSEPGLGRLSFESDSMRGLMNKALKAAHTSVPVLIEGETGTERATIARFIHENSPRKARPFVSVNCRQFESTLLRSKARGQSEVPATELESLLGVSIEHVESGTLYVEAIEKLSPAQQELLAEFVDKSGDSQGGRQGERSDVRVIASASTGLIDEVAAGRFSEDLFYRIALLVLKVPALRDRPEDIGRNIDDVLALINRNETTEGNQVDRTIAPAARTFLAEQTWPGNRRELENTLLRAATWSDKTEIDEEDVRDAMFALPGGQARTDNILGRPIADGVNLEELIEEVARHYLKRAMDHSRQNKTKAADLVGLPSYQTLSNWLKKYKVE